MDFTKLLTRSSQRRAFTLVELVMVMVIIGVLAAIIIPRFTSQRDTATISGCKANLESLRTAVSMFYAQEGRWPKNDLSDLVDGTAPSTTVYMRAIPVNPIPHPVTGLTSNNVRNGTAAITTGGGWYWDASPTGDHELHPNYPGNDANGDPYAGY